MGKELSPKTVHITIPIITAIIGLIATIVASLIGISGGRQQESIKTVELLAEKFDSVDSKMSYEQALQVIYEDSKKMKDKNKNLMDENTQLQEDLSVLKDQMDSTPVCLETLETFGNTGEMAEPKSSNPASSSDPQTKDVKLSNLDYFASRDQGDLWTHADSVRINTGAYFSDCIYTKGMRSYLIAERDYLIESKFAKLKGTIFLEYDSRSNSGESYIRILGDNKLLYESNAIKSGFLPQEFEIEIAGIDVLKIEFDYSRVYAPHFGISNVTLIADELYLEKKTNKPVKEVFLHDKPYMDCDYPNGFDAGINFVSMKIGLDEWTKDSAKIEIDNNRWQVTHYVGYALNAMTTKVKGSFATPTSNSANAKGAEAEVQINFYNESNKLLYQSPILNLSTAPIDFEFNCDDCMSLKIEFVAKGSTIITSKIQNLSIFTTDYK